MADNTTIRLIDAYFQMSKEPTRFFSGMFQTPESNFYAGMEVELDVQRQGEDVAIVIQSIESGANLNSRDQYTNKKFIAPAYKEASPLNVFDLMKRQPGFNPYVDPNYQATAAAKVFDNAMKDEQKIRRAIELQCSQIMQTGKLDLKDSAGTTTLYSVDYKPKTAHFPTASVLWDNASSTKKTDINNLGKLIRTNHLGDPNEIIFGEDAWFAWMADSVLQAELDNRRIEVGIIQPEARAGATYQGTYWLGNYKYDFWTYDGQYKDPAGSGSTLYMDPKKVIVRDNRARLDLTFGAIPNILPVDNRLMPFLPDRFSNAQRGIDMFFHAWATLDGTGIFTSVASRPLAIPTAIDSFGCITVLA
jgi:hypothetical protein